MYLIVHAGKEDVAFLSHGEGTMFMGRTPFIGFTMAVTDSSHHPQNKVTCSPLFP